MFDDFIGRLRKAVDELTGYETLYEGAAQHPEGYVVTFLSFQSSHGRVAEEA